MSQYLFSYGTLQLEKVQWENYGRKLSGVSDRLSGYRLGELEIRDPSVIAKSGKRFHPVAIKTNNPKDIVEGIIFEITDTELAETDKYEVSDYTRVEETFWSGRKAWVYVGK